MWSIPIKTGLGPCWRNQLTYKQPTPNKSVINNKNGVAINTTPFIFNIIFNIIDKLLLGIVQG